MITSRKTFSFVFGLLVILLLLSILWSISIGQIKISLLESFQVLFSQLSGRSIGQMEPALTPMITDVIWQIRIPRALLAAVVGSGLALCGTVMQASIQNPLADPYILGISSGASLGATFSIVLGHTFSRLFGSFALFVWAFIGAILATFVVLLLSNLKDGVIYTHGKPEAILTSTLVKEVYEVDCHISRHPATNQLVVAYYPIL